MPAAASAPLAFSPQTQPSWLIVGGGIHGVHIAARLIAEAHVPLSEIRIVDPGRTLLERWRECTGRTGMTHLRSPGVHHLDVNAWSLRRFASGQGRRPRAGTFAAPYDRPSLELFNEHCAEIILELGLERAHTRARVDGCRVRSTSVEVSLDDGTSLTADNVVLAMGAGEQLSWPEWAPRVDARVQHLFQNQFREPVDTDERVVVIGGGISAAQAALRFAERGHPITLLCRHAFREHQFDSDPGWLGPRYMAQFERVRCTERRRAMIAEARHRGSIPPDTHRALRRAIDQGRVEWVRGRVDSASNDADTLVLTLADGTLVSTNHVVLATGFRSERPGGAWLDALIHTSRLPLSACGYPVVDRWLRWHPRVRVTGPLAELELGPASRNIVGARRAAERIVEDLRRSPQQRLTA